MLIAVPEQPFDPLQVGQQILARRLIMVSDTTCVLTQHRQTHGDREPIEHVFGFRSDKFR
jgi:hypothetical protein